MITMSTVGYGDYAPATTLGRIFAVGYILLGVWVLTACAGRLVTDAFALCQSLFVAALRHLVGPLERRVERHGERAHILAEHGVAPVLPRRWHFFLEALGFHITFGIALVFFASAYAFTFFNSMAYGEALWLAFVTASTVGYGDVPITAHGQSWAIVHTFVSVSFLASCYELVTLAQAEWRLRVQRDELMRAQLSEELIEKLDPKGTGLDKAHFVARMLMLMGAELCGQSLDFATDIAPLLRRFEVLDQDHSGVLTRDDLTFMVAEAKKAQHEQVAAEARTRAKPPPSRGRTAMRTAPLNRMYGLGHVADCSPRLIASASQSGAPKC